MSFGRARGGYQLVDEPAPGPLGHLVVRPLFPFLGFMLGGAWLGLPWYVFNAFAVGSPTRWKELWVAVLGLAFTAGCVGLIWWLDGREFWTDVTVRFAFLAIVLFKVGLSYALQNMQGRSFELYTYYGGVVRNGLWVAVLGFAVRSSLLDLMPLWLQVILA